MKKMLLLVVVLLSFNLVNVFALQGKEDLPQNALIAEDDKVVKVADETEKLAKGKLKSGVMIGIEGGYNWETLSENMSSHEDNITFADHGKVGVTISGYLYREGDVGIAKHSSTTAIGYNFVDDGWGIYLSTDYNRNIPLGKKNNSYFYFGVGTGASLNVYDDSSAYEDRCDYNWQMVRIPIGFKFLVTPKVELFFEGSGYVGVGGTFTMDNGSYRDANGDKQHITHAMSAGFETKGGIRFFIG